MKFTKSYDVVVVGAGIAGVAAALAAARRGHKVALVEKQTLIGGLACSGLIFVYLPLCDGNNRQVTYGIAEELLLKSLDYSPFDVPKRWQNDCELGKDSEQQRYRVYFSPASLTLAMDEALAEANVDLWLDSRVCAVQQSTDKITAIELENCSGRITVSAECFIDGSGEAALVRQAGGEILTEDNYLSLWLMQMSPNASQIYHFTDSLHIKPFKYSDEAYKHNGLEGKGVSEYTRDCWQKLREYYKESYESGESNRYNHYPVHLPAMAQFRKIAAAKCHYMLNTAEDQLSFDDSIGLTGDWRKAGPIWETPFRSLVPKKIDGLFVAGRCMGAIGDAWEVYRVIPPAAMTGEAAGIAAALCVEKRCSAQEINPKDVQEVLLEKGIPLKK